MTFVSGDMRISDSNLYSSRYCTVRYGLTECLPYIVGVYLCTIRLPPPFPPPPPPPPPPPRIVKATGELHEAVIVREYCVDAVCLFFSRHQAFKIGLVSINATMVSFDRDNTNIAGRLAVLFLIGGALLAYSTPSSHALLVAQSNATSSTCVYGYDYAPYCKKAGTDWRDFCNAEDEVGERFRAVCLETCRICKVCIYIVQKGICLYIQHGGGRHAYSSEYNNKYRAP